MAAPDTSSSWEKIRQGVKGSGDPDRSEKIQSVYGKIPSDTGIYGPLPVRKGSQSSIRTCPRPSTSCTAGPLDQQDHLRTLSQDPHAGQQGRPRRQRKTPTTPTRRITCFLRRYIRLPTITTAGSAARRRRPPSRPGSGRRPEAAAAGNGQQTGPLPFSSVGADPGRRHCRRGDSPDRHHPGS